MFLTSSEAANSNSSLFYHQLIYAAWTDPPGSTCAPKLNRSCGYLTPVSVPFTCLFHPLCIS